MTSVIVECNTCQTILCRDIDINLNDFQEIHKGHDFQITFHNVFDEKYKVRPMIRHLSCIHLKNPLVGVEIGIRRGEHAFSILSYLNMKMLYLVDPYEFYDGYDITTEDGNADYNKSSPKESYLSAVKLLKKFDNKVFIKKKSEDAINKIPDNLDFVYIDGNHDYEHVKQDLELYYKKTKIGGYIGGHDFGLHRVQLVKAVADFIEEHEITNCTSNGIDFWMKKEE